MIHAICSGYVSEFVADTEDPEVCWLDVRSQRPRLHAGEDRRSLPYTAIRYRWHGPRAVATLKGGYLPEGRQVVIRGPIWLMEDGIGGSLDDIELIGEPPRKVVADTPRKAIADAAPEPAKAAKPRPKRGKSSL